MAPESFLWTPSDKEWKGDVYQGKRPHFARVLRMGPPMRTPVRRDGSGGAEVAYGFKVGDRVWFVYALLLEKMRSFSDRLAIVGQEEIVAVVEE